MHTTALPQLTTVELIDALEAEIAAIRSRKQGPSPSDRDSATIDPVLLRTEMRRNGVSAVNLAKAAGVSNEDVNGWIQGGSAIPSWVLAVIRLYAQLTPSARRKVLNGAREETANSRNNSHPFSRIEEL